MLTLHSIPAFQDNYIWVLVNEKLKEAIVVDPGDAQPVLAFLNKNNLSLTAILLTHKHADHTGGVAQLCGHYKNSVVYASKQDQVEYTNYYVSEEKNIVIEHWPCSFTVIEIPGHTLGHVAYYSNPYLFCGDTLFGAGCGRVFEGTPAQMLESLKKLLLLPDETKVCCGHEYTVNNLKFALQVEPDNQDIQQRMIESKKLREENKPTLPSTLMLEKKTNPFLRCDVEAVSRTVASHANKKLNAEVDIFAAMREWKNHF